jgi:hypothetical protein
MELVEIAVLPVFFTSGEVSAAFDECWTFMSCVRGGTPCARALTTVKQINAVANSQLALVLNDLSMLVGFVDGAAFEAPRKCPVNIP